MRTRLLVLSLCGLLGACSSLGEITGLVAGAAAGGATANPVVGYVVAVGTAAVADETFNWISRTRHRGEQDAIAAAAATLPEGGAGVWEIRHDLPYGNAHGEVHVVRAIDTPLARCREIVFSVIDDPPDPPLNFATTICQQDPTQQNQVQQNQVQTWKWANAEWAVERWGAVR